MADAQLRYDVLAADGSVTRHIFRISPVYREYLRQVGLKRYDKATEEDVARARALWDAERAAEPAPEVIPPPRPGPSKRPYHHRPRSI